MKSKFHILIILLLACVNLSAQELTIRSFRQSNDIIARIDERKDLNNQPCALIKVQVALKDVKFEGSVIGEPLYKTSEYWVYVPQGKQTLRIKHPNYLPLEMKLPYGDEVKELQSNRVYMLTLVLPGASNAPEAAASTSGGIMLNVVPANAKVTIDGIARPLGENGSCLAMLSDGEHEYTVSAEGYTTKTETFTIKSQPIQRSVQLERDIASLSIETDIDGAEIMVNGERKGSVSWKGQLSSGPVEISIMKTGYKPYRQTIALKTNENKVIRISLKDLEVTTGSVRVSCNVEGASVYVDDEYKGTTPGEFRRIPTGKHQLKVTKDGYDNYTTDVEIPENRFANVDATLKEGAKILKQREEEKKRTIREEAEKRKAQQKEAERKAKEEAKKQSAYTPPAIYEHTTTENKSTTQRVTYKAPKPKHYASDDEPRTGIYIEPSYQLLSYSGFGVEVGAFISNFNLEAQYLIGASKSDKIYWYASDGSQNGNCEYGSNRLAFRAGYRIALGSKLDLTPQLGAGILMVSAKESTSKINDKSNAGSMLISARMTLSLSRNFQLAITPEYSLAVSKGKVYEQASQVSSAMKSWADGFNLRAGISIFF